MGCPRLLLVLALAAGVGGVARAGHLEHHQVAGRTVRTYIPTALMGKPLGGARVIVAHDGQNLFGGGPSGSWDLHLALEGLMARGAIPPAVILGVDHAGAGRNADYAMRDGGAAGYLRRVRTQILPWAQQRYGLDTRPANVVGLGSSMGAHPQLEDMIEEPGKPQVFGAWGVLSPALRANPTHPHDPRAGALARFRGAPQLRRGRTFLFAAAAEDPVDLKDELKLELEQRGGRHGRDHWDWTAPGRTHSEGTWKDFSWMALHVLLSPNPPRW